MTAYLNGQFLPLAEARISPLDRGFLYADGGYEVIPVYSRHPFRIDEHLHRFQHTLDGIRLPNPHSIEQWRAIILRLIAQAPFDDQTVYIQVTRGADTKRDQLFPKGVAPTVFLFTAPLAGPTAAQRENGVAVITTADIRWGRCDLKSVALLANILARQQAADANCTEAIMLRDGLLTEGSATNVFCVKNGVIITPAKDHRILPGITYDVVLELAVRHGAAHQVRDVSEAELRSADELWLTSSTKEVLAITTLDGKPVGSGKPGPVTRQMHEWYVAFRDGVMRRG
ncbi:MAG: D-amino acid aminotransferase [Proteobacteria bacterium]|nr:D-amino acid aminotransferase [Pseudomonadota bacterium]